MDLSHPCVIAEPEMIKNRVSIYNDPYDATQNTHAIVLCTEWDEFVVSIFIHYLYIFIYYLFYNSMKILIELVLASHGFINKTENKSLSK